MDGYGSHDALLMIVAEAPGYNEDKHGRPLIGDSGAEINTLLELGGISPQSVYKTNAVKCRPPGNRDPKPDELDECRSWLVEELETIHPRVLLVLGQVAKRQIAQTLPSLPAPLHPVEVVYAAHPAAFMHKPNPAKKEKWAKTIHYAIDRALDREIVVPLEEPWEWRESDPELFRALLEYNDVLSLDTEYDVTTAPIPSLVSWSLGNDAIALFVDHADSRSPAWLAEAWEWSRDPTHVLVGSNIIQADIPVCQTAGIHVPDDANIRDTMLEAYVARELEVGLKDLGVRYANMDVLKYTDVVPTRKKRRLDFSEALADPTLRAGCCSYGAQDSILGVRVHTAVAPKLNDAQQDRLLTLEQPLAHILADMHSTGVLLDQEPARKMASFLYEEAERHKQAAWLVLGDEPPLTGGDGQRLAERLRSMGLPLTRRTKKDKGWSTAEEHLQEAVAILFKARDTSGDPDAELSPAVNAVSEVLAFRGHFKNYTFVDGLIQASAYDGRVHTTFRQAGSEKFTSTETSQGPATGRLSSADPNLQNIPVRSEFGKKMRRLFIPSDGMVWVCGDYGQIELRYFAHVTRSPFLIEAFTSPKKVHTMVAEELGVTYDQAKTTVYAVLYGVEADKVATDLHMSSSEASAFLRRLQSSMPEILAWPKTVERELSQRGYVDIMGGWRAYYPEYFSGSNRLKREALREAANAKIQGGAATIAKKLQIEAYTLAFNYGSNMLLQVHDELDFESPLVAADRFAEALRELGAEIGRFYDISVPLEFEVKIGESWGGAK